MHTSFSDILRIMSEIVFNNTYEEDPSTLPWQEMLQNLDMTTRIGIHALGTLRRGNLVLDIDVDRTTRFAVLADACSLPIASEVAETICSRFVLSRCSDQDTCSQVIQDTFHTVSPGGKAVFIEYDWTKMRGSPVIEHFRDFALDTIPLFSAGTFEDMVVQYLHNDQVTISTKRTGSLLHYDYRPILKLQEMIVKDLHRENASRFTINEAAIILNALQTEANSTNPQGFLMPDIVEIIATKLLTFESIQNP